VFRLNATAEAKDAHQSALAEEHAKAQTLQQQISALQAQADEVPGLKLAISTLESAKAGLRGDVERLKGLEAGICALTLRQSAKLNVPQKLRSRKMLWAQLKPRSALSRSGPRLRTLSWPRSLA
jgi:hypothetical protein